MESCGVCLPFVIDDASIRVHEKGQVGKVDIVDMAVLLVLEERIRKPDQSHLVFGESDVGHEAIVVAQPMVDPFLFEAKLSFELLEWEVRGGRRYRSSAHSGFLTIFCSFTVLTLSKCRLVMMRTGGGWPEYGVWWNPFGVGRSSFRFTSSENGLRRVWMTFCSRHERYETG